MGKREGGGDGSMIALCHSSLLPPGLAQKRRKERKERGRLRCSDLAIPRLKQEGGGRRSLRGLFLYIDGRKKEE